MWFIGRMMRISWTEKKSNELILKEANLERSLIKTIRQRQQTFLGHICRHKGLEHLATTGKIEGKRSRDRQRITFIENLKSWAIDKGSNNNFINLTENKFEWRNMIANVCSRQGFSHGQAVEPDVGVNTINPKRKFSALFITFWFWVTPYTTKWFQASRPRSGQGASHESHWEKREYTFMRLKLKLKWELRCLLAISKIDIMPELNAAHMEDDKIPGLHRFCKRSALGNTKTDSVIEDKGRDNNVKHKVQEAWDLLTT
ncbi:endonuclease-reverse transcriptase [Plakobranchus ocellatus]|uniref:Endonuclease-reverse transcriptase n=1 Tax=Plakobranchus ocellatus TaxID=259542 RepID=A0AAV4BT15_9GAST|nr:endonuclease-reverse transcriptase [Plakobranchus ocellatus]